MNNLLAFEYLRQGHKITRTEWIDDLNPKDRHTYYFNISNGYISTSAGIEYNLFGLEESLYNDYVVFEDDQGEY